MTEDTETVSLITEAIDKLTASIMCVADMPQVPLLAETMSALARAAEETRNARECVRRFEAAAGWPLSPGAGQRNAQIIAAAQQMPKVGYTLEPAEDGNSFNIVDTTVFHDEVTRELTPITLGRGCSLIIGAHSRACVVTEISKSGKTLTLREVEDDCSINDTNGRGGIGLLNHPNSPPFKVRWSKYGSFKTKDRSYIRWDAGRTYHDMGV